MFLYLYILDISIFMFLHNNHIWLIKQKSYHRELRGILLIDASCRETSGSEMQQVVFIS